MRTALRKRAVSAGLKEAKKYADGSKKLPATYI